VKCGIDKFSRIFFGKMNGFEIAGKRMGNGICFEKPFDVKNKK
jgi:hypothetical protein